VTGFLNSRNGGHCTEAVWNEVASPIGPLATGGGLSVLHPTPDFQLGLPQDLLQGRRGVPDISWNAALDGGVVVYIRDYGFSFNGWINAYGTSASTPQLAGLIALANQLRAEYGKGPIGYLNPILYALDYWVFRISNKQNGNSYQGDLEGIEHYSNERTAQAFAIGITVIAAFQGYRLLKTQDWAPDWLKAAPDNVNVLPLHSGGAMLTYEFRF